MDQRLVSENIMQCNGQSASEFSASGHLVAFKTEDSIRIKTFNKQIRECNVKVEGIVSKYFLVSVANHHYLNVQYEKGTLQIFMVWQEGNEIKSKNHFQIPSCTEAVHQSSQLLFFSKKQNECFIKVYEYKTGKIQTIGKCHPQTYFLQHGGSKIATVTQAEQKNPIIRLYDKEEGQRDKNIETIDYVSCPIAIYQDRYIFQNCHEEHQVEIYDISLSKLVGKFAYMGNLQHTSLLESNILLIVTNNENVDKYYFFFLNPRASEEGIIKNRIVYEKGKGSWYGICNMNEEYAKMISSGKGTFADWSNQGPSTFILLYVQAKNKAKVEIMRISYAKILENHFQEDRHDTIIHSKYHSSEKRQSQQKAKRQDHALEGEKVRVAASMHHKKGDSLKNIEEVQRKMIEHLVEVKVKGIMERFTELEKRLTNLENQIGIITNRIEKSIENINKDEIKRNVEMLFERVTPQFQSYFTEVFRQISGVMDQGVNYYNVKLAKESEAHRDALSQVINMTFDATEEIVELGRKESKHSEETEKNIEKLLQIRKKWETQTRGMMAKMKGSLTNSEIERKITLNEESPGSSSKQSTTRTPNRR